jgi:hypothetical protein
MNRDYFDLGAMQKELVEYHRKKGFSNPEDLLDFIEGFWGLRLPRIQVCPGHTPPADYIVDSFFESVLDSVCWANRGGGKTLNGALLTWLDTVFKKGCETKILGGSGEQSLRMYNHISKFQTPPFRHLIDGEPLKSLTRMNDGGSIQVLTASSKSVRGPHPQKLRLDEIDEFEDKIYEAAMLIPKTKHGLRASVQIYSTMHKAYGLMNRVISEAAQSGYKIYKWCIFDVLEKCVGRECAVCELWEDCQGKAKQADGFYSIENAISEKRRVSRDTWLCEMLCFQPSQEGLIYKEFDYALHVV